MSLRAKLCSLPEQDVEERINFYTEMIDDRMEEGLSEEQAVAEIGSVDVIAQQVLADVPLAKLAILTLSLMQTERATASLPTRVIKL